MNLHVTGKCTNYIQREDNDRSFMELAHDRGV